MKKTILIPIACSLFAGSGFAETYNYTKSRDSHDWNDTAAWNVNGGQPSSVPSINDDVVFYGDDWITIGSGSNIEINSFDAVNAGWCWGLYTLPMKANSEANRDLSIDGDVPPVDQYVAPTLRVTNDMKLASGGLANLTFQIGNGAYRRGFSNITVGGNFEIGYQSLTMAFDAQTDYKEGTYSLDIGGVMSVTKVENQPLSRIALKYGNDGGGDGKVNAWVRLGGLDAANAIICNNDSNTSTTIIFQAQDGKAFTGGDFSGQLTNWWSGGSKMAVIMDGGSGGKQVMRLSKISTDGNEHTTTLDVTVRSGKLGMYTQYVDADNNQKLASLTMNGGKFVIENSSADAAAIDAVVHAGAMIWNGGAVRMSVDGTGFGRLVVDSLSGDGEYLFMIDAANLDDVIGADIFKITGDYSMIGEDAFSVKIGSDYLGLFAWENGVLQVTGYTPVPEPAAVAAVIGALALALAAYRKRK